ncbi:NADH-quinone oxidoreductase subunit C [Streptomyces sp. AD681]|uniref:NADH-quinone oxidoreductase subunit C n=1 Tax=Streptomyces sp. AD681 TaxID=3019069 RepID=UPI0022F17518|nr:NADH-quinone oxidoreductase subunit C [Streptomyces sp. AD681]MDA5144848.1 NADH-quinone oxidoreductase subunit C [Streptomyces sp. AD681]
MTAVGWLPADAAELFGPDAAAAESYELLTVDVPPTSWITALETARDRLGCTYFDWLSAVDEPGTGFRVAAHVVALGPVRRLLLRTTVPHDAPVLPTAVAVYAGAAWHERETHEMFGVAFADHPALDHLLLPEGFEGHPLRKDFVLAARVAKAWPGAKEPGESDHGGPRRRQMLPPGVPDPNEWGPLKGQLPPAPARPARGAGRAAGERPVRGAGERPARRTRTAAEGSVGQTAPDAGTPAAPRRSRTAAEGSAGQTSPAGEPAAAPAPRRSRSASQGSASQRAAAPPDGPTSDTAAGQQGDAGAVSPRRTRSASQGSASLRKGEAPDAGQPDDAAAGGGPRGDTGNAPSPTGEPAPKPTPTAEPASKPTPTEEPTPQPTPSAPRSPDAPWHHARPAFDEPTAATTAAAAEGAGVSDESADAPEESEASQESPAVPEESEAPQESPAVPEESEAPHESPDAPREPGAPDDTDTPPDPPNSPGGPQ